MYIADQVIFFSSPLMSCMKVMVYLCGYSFPPILLWTEDLQDWAWGGEPALQALQAAPQPPAAVARLPHHQLRWDTLAGSADSSSWSSCGRWNSFSGCLHPCATGRDNLKKGISVWGAPCVICHHLDNIMSPKWVVHWCPQELELQLCSPGSPARWIQCCLCVILLPQSYLFISFLQTGYMFGKGIYFADMVSKSANYCHTSQADPIGLVLLGEVALGNMYVTYKEYLPNVLNASS